MLDTLRAYHVRCYGYKYNTTPSIDKIAQKSVLFENAVAQSDFTLSSHSSLFSGQYVKTHRVKNVESLLLSDTVTLAECFKYNGYVTGAFVCNAVQLSPKYNLNQGFDTYFYDYNKRKRRKSIEITYPKAIAWLEANKGKKFFIFLHANDIHEPYHSVYENIFDPAYKGRLDSEFFAIGGGDGFYRRNLTRTEREIRHIVAHYDGGIRLVDSFVGLLDEYMEKTGLWDNTIFVILSDHGEILGDRVKGFFHGYALYCEEVHVPLIIYVPGIRGNKRIGTLVELVDIIPTLLDFAGIDIPDDVEGESLRPLISGKGKYNKKYAYADSIKGESENNDFFGRVVMVRNKRWKLIGNFWNYFVPKESLPRYVKLYNGAIISMPQEDSYELYDLKKDPFEKRNLFDKKKGRGITKTLLSEMADYLSE